MQAKNLSILSALTSSACCVPPLILLGISLIGIGGAGLAGLSSTLGALKWYLLPLAFVGLGSSYYLYFRDKKTCASQACRMVNQKLTKVMLTVSTVVVTGFLSWSVYPYILGAEEISTSGNQSSPHLAVFQVDGMTCGGCEIAIDGAINATGLADSVKSSFIEGKAYIWYSDTDTKPVEFEKALNSVGYTAKLEKAL
ncbi:MAG: cation transporter [Candidatus Zixiibacteriota bacterium]